MAIVLVLREGLKKQFFTLEESLKVGRHVRNDIVLTNIKVSAFHGQFYKTGDIVFYKDLNSRNGSFLNGTRVMFCRLLIEDKLVIEGVTFFVDKTQLTENELCRLSKAVEQLKI